MIRSAAFLDTKIASVTNASDPTSGFYDAHMNYLGWLKAFSSLAPFKMRKDSRKLWSNSPFLYFSHYAFVKVGHSVFKPPLVGYFGRVSSNSAYNRLLWCLTHHGCNTSCPSNRYPPPPPPPGWTPCHKTLYVDSRILANGLGMPAYYALGVIPLGGGGWSQVAGSTPAQTDHTHRRKKQNDGAAFALLLARELVKK